MNTEKIPFNAQSENGMLQISLNKVRWKTLKDRERHSSASIGFEFDLPAKDAETFIMHFCDSNH